MNAAIANIGLPEAMARGCQCDLCARIASASQVKIDSRIAADQARSVEIAEAAIKKAATLFKRISDGKVLY